MVSMDQHLMYEAALRLDQMGYWISLLRQGSKTPAVKAWQERGRFTTADLKEWFSRRMFNIGILMMNGIVVVDYDRKELMERRMALGIPPTPQIGATVKGFHGYYRTMLSDPKTIIKWRGHDIDILAGKRYAVAPPSFIAATGWRYTWVKGPVNKAELPLFPEELLQDERPAPSIILAKGTIGRRDIKNPKAYVMRIISQEGANGSGALVRAVAICRDSGMSSDETYRFLTEQWNFSNALPPWPNESIARAINRHYQA
jgi:hypothetical protein